MNSNFSLIIIVSNESKPVVEPSTVLAPPLDVLKLCQFTLYIISGICALISSFLVIFTIERHSSLHTKNYYLLAGLAAADFVRGLAYIIGGVFRDVFIIGGTSNYPIAPQKCMNQIYQSLIIYGQTASVSMVLVLSIDRFLAIYYFNMYRLLGPSYALISIGMVNAEGALFVVVAWLVSYLANDRSVVVRRVCLVEEATTYPFYAVQMGFRFIPGLITGVFYVATLILIKLKARDMANRTSSFRKQVKITKSFATVMINTILFSSIPFGYSFVILSGGLESNTMYDALSPFVYCLSLLSASTNLLVYAYNYENFRNLFIQQWNLRKKTSTVVHPVTFMSPSPIPSPRRAFEVEARANEVAKEKQLIVVKRDLWGNNRGAEERRSREQEERNRQRQREEEERRRQQQRQREEERRSREQQERNRQRQRQEEDRRRQQQRQRELEERRNREQQERNRRQREQEERRRRQEEERRRHGSDERERWNQQNWQRNGRWNP